MNKKDFLLGVDLVKIISGILSRIHTTKPCDASYSNSFLSEHTSQTKQKSFQGNETKFLKRFWTLKTNKSKTAIFPDFYGLFFRKKENKI